ncbi:MAG: MFS transporter [Dehalococcoidia bacterium]
MTAKDAKPPSPPAPNAAGDSVVPGVEKNVFRLGVVSFWTDISGEMIYPLVPIFLTETLGAPRTVVGAIEGLAESTVSVFRVVSGWLSDKVGKRKPFVLAGYSLSAVGKLFLAVAFHWPTVLVARVVDRFGKGVRSSPRDALVAQWTPPSVRGRAFGFHRAADTAGAVLGPLAALALMALIGDNYRLIFALALAPALLAVVLLRGVREAPSAPAEQRSAPRPQFRQFGRSYYVFLAINLVFALGNSSDVFIILRARDLGLGVSEAVLAYVLYNLVYALLAMPAGIASDRLGRRGVVASGFAIFAAVYFGFAVIDAAAYVWLLFAVYGVYIALTEGVGRALVTDFVGPQWRGTALGLYQGAMALMLLLSSVLAGVLWDQVSPAAPFFLGGSTAALAFLLAVLLLPRRRLLGQG